jgi:hypothetical protein
MPLARYALRGKKGFISYRIAKRYIDFAERQKYRIAKQYIDKISNAKGRDGKPVPYADK